jgi:RND family efflux transporter MFP subunit
MKPENGRVLHIIPVLLLSALIFPACDRKTTRPQATPLPVAKVRVLPAQRQQRVATEEVVGTVQARLRTVLEAKVSGRIEKMLVAPGETVQAGALLVQIDAREIQARLDQAMAVRDQANLDLDRLRKLIEQRAVSRQEFDNAQARQRVAVANVLEAETMLGYMRVTAPFAGTVTRKHADVGDLAAPGKALLEMEDSRALRLEADVPEALIGNVQLGETYGARVSSVTHELPAVASEIAPAADPGSRTFLVKFDLPATPGVRAGQFGRVAVPIGQRTALSAPASAVIQRGQMEIVFVVADGRAHLRLVKSGKRLGDQVELVSGLEPGENVVTEGAKTLRDGQPVEVVDAK